MQEHVATPEWVARFDAIHRSMEDGDVKRRTLADLADAARSAGQSFPWQMKNGQVLVISPTEGGVPFMTVGWTCFTSGEWEPNIERCFPSLLSAGDYAIDIGANLGYFTTSMAAHVPDGHVYAFEPLASTFERLALACEINGLRNVTLFRDALSAAPGTGRLWAHETATGNASLVRDAIARLARPREVPVTTLDLLFDRGAFARVDLVKVDVEGHELDVLRGGERLLRRFKPHLILEFNERMSRLAGWGPRELSALLASFGEYEIYRIDEDRLIHVRLTELTVDRNTHIDLLALAAGRRRGPLAGVD